MSKIVNLIFLCVLSISYAQEIKFGKVSKEELSEKSYAKDPDADAAYLLKKENIYYEYNGNKGWYIVKEVHERVKLYTKEGFDYATKKIKLFDQGGVDEKITYFKAYTYNLNGSKIDKVKLGEKEIFKEEISENWFAKKFTMPNLKEGTVVEWKYTVNSPYSKYIDELVLQHLIPIKELDISVKIPEYFGFKKHQKGYISIPLKEGQVYKSTTFQARSETYSPMGHRQAKTNLNTISFEFNQNNYIIKNKNIPALQPEPYTSDLSNHISTLILEFSYTNFNQKVRHYASSWKDVSKNINKSYNFGEEIDKTAYYKDELNSILGQHTSDLAKMKGIFNFVKSHTKWNNTNGIYIQKGVRKAFKEKSGNVADINLSLVSMLRSANLDADPVLVSTRENGVVLFPTISGFNYVIAHVKLNGKSYLLDATSPYALENILPQRALNWKGRILQENNVSNWVDLSKMGEAIIVNNLKVRIDEDKKVQGVFRTTYKKQAAFKFRHLNNSISDDKLISTLENSKNIDISEFKINNKNKLDKNVIRKVTFSSEDLMEEINGELHLNPLLFLGVNENPFKSEKRTLPVDFGTLKSTNHKVVLEIPEGYILKSLPEALAIKMSDNLGFFKFQTAVSGNKITILSSLNIHSSIVPLDYYSELKMLFDKAVKKQGEKIILSPK